MSKTVILVATLDTKSEEAKFIKDYLEHQDIKVVTIDVGTGIKGSPIFSPDYKAEEIADEAGTSLSELIKMGHGNEMLIMEKMIAGASNVVGRLYAGGQLDGIISIGGTMGTNLGCSIMRSLPFGVPKVMLSTAASGDTRNWVGTKDITMMPSVADIAGLDRITRLSLRRAAGAITGMVFSGEEATSHRPLIGVTTLGGTTECAIRFKNTLEEKGFEVAIFHAIGTGGMAMEELIEEGKIQGVFDLSTNELLDHLYGGMTDAGPNRLEAAGKKGLPCLVAPGNLDHLLYTSIDRIPAEFKNREVHKHGPTIHLLRSRKAEMEKVGLVMANKLNQAKGPAKIIFPNKGFSVGQIFLADYFNDPEADSALLETLRENLRSDIEIIVCDCHITDGEFANRATEIYLDMHSLQ